MKECLNCGNEVKNKYCNTSCQNRHLKRKPSRESIEKMKKTVASKWNYFMVDCSICDKQFEIKEFDVDKPKKEKYYCSRGCANTRNHSVETKLKMSKSIQKLWMDNVYDDVIRVYKPKKLHRKTCEYCDNEFETFKMRQRFCSIKCARLNNIKLASIVQQQKMKDDPTWWSDIQKNLYRTGKQKVGGGTTKWYSVNTSNGIIRVQGTYEVETCKILDDKKRKNEIDDWEYTNDRIEYIGLDDKKHTYLIDFKVFKNDTFYYLEVKGYEKPIDKLKWESVRKQGYELIVWFQDDIFKNYIFG